MHNKKSDKILFQLTGSIATYKSCALISRLVQEGHTVQVVASAQALEFVGTATLEGLSGRPVIHHVFQEGHKMDHIHLARWCDWAILCPATAHTINQLAHGLANDLIGALFLAFDRKKPYWLAPAMNTFMYEHPATQASLKTLKEWGVRILEPGSGFLACKEVGAGRLMDERLILEKILEHYKTESLSLLKTPLKVLITAGATREAVDAVRYISNISTGSTAATLAEEFLRQGHRVSYLCGKDAKVPAQLGTLETIDFTSVVDLDKKIHEKLSQDSYDLVIHAAAVSDFIVEGIHTDEGAFKATEGVKISSGQNIQLHLKPSVKILAKIRSYSRSNLMLIAFKLTQNASEEERQVAVQKIFEQALPEYVVHNDLSEIAAHQIGGSGTRDLHKTRIYSRTGFVEACSSKKELASALVSLSQGGS
ncbi:MAG: bifunctional phosphopantothenoylcysteine decarboxylase/phosphopantothenate--cysteine ligase CoaBC [Oligoflexales bacterium]|nr:bifunctional phosphopantothenoylcysteine decarboxylase/phosphopantothenate--cysteine ligase CoaBC [Oligoflexales bacterium]